MAFITRYSFFINGYLVFLNFLGWNKQPSIKGMGCCCDDIWNSLMFDQLLISLCIEVGHEILVKIEFFEVIVHWKYGSKSRFKGNEKFPISAGFIHFDRFLRIIVPKKGCSFFICRKFWETCQNIVSWTFAECHFKYSLVVMASKIDLDFEQMKIFW